MADAEKGKDVQCEGLRAEDASPRYDTTTLFGGKREIVIRHGDADYRMKITRQGKLILNK